MWVLSWKQYKISKLATSVSVIGALTRYGGVLCLFGALIPAAVICLAIGIGCHFWAEEIAFSAWKKTVHAKGYEIKVIQGDLQIAIQLYNAKPEKKTLAYFDSLNPQVAAQIRAMVANKNEK